jgi:hypothetical protein
MTGFAPRLDANQRQTFAALADVLVPEALGMPAASAVGIAEALLDRVLELRPELAPDLLRAIASVSPDEPASSAAERLNRDDPAAMGAVGLVASAAYYMHPEVRRRLGYPGQTQRPIQPDEEDDFRQDGLIDVVIARGPIYRPTPT